MLRVFAVFVLLVSMVSCGPTMPVQNTTGCVGTPSQLSTGESAPGWAMSYDCASAVCTGKAPCVLGSTTPTSGTRATCTTTGERSLCTDAQDNDHDGRQDCDDCSCWSDAACASAATCEALPATSLSPLGYGAMGLPACIPTFQLFLVQSGCDVWAQMRGTGRQIPSVGPLPLQKRGAHQWHLEWSDDLTQNGQTNIYLWSLDADTSAGTITGTFGRKTNGAISPTCGWTAF